MSEIIKIIGERERKKTKNKDRMTQRRGGSYSESVRAKWFCCAFRVSFINYFKRKGIVRVKACCSGV